jgi:iron-sulfur cluster insertion protein
MNDMTRPDGVFSLSEAAARRVCKLSELDGKPDQMLRITVSGGGCSGFQYGFSFADTAADDDLIFDRDGAKVVIDTVSLELLGGAELHFVDDLMGSYFQIRNPNATSSCGCGVSFSIG